MVSEFTLWLKHCLVLHRVHHTVQVALSHGQDFHTRPIFAALLIGHEADDLPAEQAKCAFLQLSLAAAALLLVVGSDQSIELGGQLNEIEAEECREQVQVDWH